MNGRDRLSTATMARSGRRSAYTTVNTPIHRSCRPDHRTADEGSTAMTTARSLAMLMLVASMGACNERLEPVSPDAAAIAEVSNAMAPARIAANGTFTQTGITSLEVTNPGQNTVIEQISVGVISGTISGAYEDRLKVVIHPNGRFTTHFTISCECTVNGKQGTVEMVAQDDGQLTSPAVAAFAGRAIITGATGQLTGLGGVLAIEGAVDVPSGLSTYDYSGSIRLRP
jgi:hypothetical protein